MSEQTQKIKIGHVHADCTREEKASYIKAAQEEGLKVDLWVIKTLNEAIKKKLQKK